MRKIVIMILCCLLLAMTASAAGVVTSGQSHTVVSSDGSCDVTLTITLQFDAPVGELSFPLPPR